MHCNDSKQKDLGYKKSNAKENQRLTAVISIKAKKFTSNISKEPGEERGPLMLSSVSSLASLVTIYITMFVVVVMMSQ